MQQRATTLRHLRARTATRMQATVNRLTITPLLALHRRVATAAAAVLVVEVSAEAAVVAAEEDLAVAAVAAVVVDKSTGSETKVYD